MITRQVLALEGLAVGLKGPGGEWIQVGTLRNLEFEADVSERIEFWDDRVIEIERRFSLDMEVHVPEGCLNALQGLLYTESTRRGHSL